MLIDFRFENFRSFRKQQTLSLAAYERLTDGLISHSVDSGRKDIPRLLKAAAIYGANASGKSNLIKALQFMRAKVVNERLVSSCGWSEQPFRLSADAPDLPTKFEVSLLLGSVRYQYGFSALHEKITEEYLLAYVNPVPQTWFERHFEASQGLYFYKYSPSFRGIKSTWEKATAPEALYLTTAVSLNCEQLKPIFQWFEKRFVVINELSPLNEFFTITRILGTHDSSDIDALLRASDLGLSGTEIIPKQVPGKTITFDTKNETSKVKDVVLNKYDVFFKHQRDGKDYRLPFEEESFGSQKLYKLAGPILDMLDKDITLAIDEMDASLHPMLLEQIIRLFISREKHGTSQLIFTTHCDALLENSTIPNSSVEPLLRRDQVWFIEKNAQLESDLISLQEYKPRKNESIRDGYRRGRYGAIPLLVDTELS